MRSALASIVLLVAIATPASAQELSEHDRAIARDHFDRGTLAFERGDYADASAEFRAAYELTHHADLLYNIYTAQERNGELAEAAAALEGYLRDGDPDEARREALELRLERLQLRLEQERLQAAEQEAATRREREEADAQLEAERAERAAAEERADSERGERLAQVAARHQTSDALVVTGVVVLVAGGLGLGGFGVFAGLSESEDASLASRCGRDAGRVCRAADTTDLETFNTGADVSLVVGASLAVIGGAVILIGESLRPSDANEATARVWPALGPGYAGVAAGGRW
ncbi:MAG: hypothetical protein H6719_36405 [Sandaracinaceae bacterium]|nr:hypothetical protein [Sandaracinaceae bacterium]